MIFRIMPFREIWKPGLTSPFISTQLNFRDILIAGSCLIPCYQKISSAVVSQPPIQAIVYQLSKENGLIYNSLYIKHTPIFQASDMRIWQTRLQAPLAIKPQIIINHNTKTKEILVRIL